MNKIILITIILLSGLLLFGCTSSENTTNNPNTQTQQAQEYAIGESFTADNLEFKVISFDEIYALGSEYLYKEASEGAMFYLIELNIKNNSNSEKTVTISNDIQIIDSKGRTYKPDSTASMYAKQSGFETFSIIETIQAGLSKTGMIVFEMPEETTGKLKIKPNMFSQEVTVNLN
ncbi:MAG: DUF4352 domain-containing protein [Candidatus ainarchaeum sp.]|nr:DUF4352 domain-containing protein [Candidatus ainarchaeum sp.]